jgi:hypothetical protein
MFSIANGSARLVLCFGHYVIKLPRGIEGCACNRHEATVWRRSSERGRQLLCPILIKAPFGLFLVMRRADIADEHDEKWRAARDAAYLSWDSLLPDDECPFEPKACDWGWLDGRLVAVDYAATAPRQRKVRSNL